MTLLWRFKCDGAGCRETVDTPPLSIAPPGWMTRTVIDSIESLDEPATGTGFPKGRSELQRVKHFCEACRRKVAAA